MKALVLSRLWIVCVILVTLTLVTALTSEEQGLTTLTALVFFAIAAVKAVLVLENFMEVSQVERHWQWLYRLWIAGVTTLLIVGFAI